jgi:hypothetical protein
VLRGTLDVNGMLSIVVFSSIVYYCLSYVG